MKVNSSFSACVVFVLSFCTSSAQEATDFASYEKNLIKVNLTGFLWQNYGMQYERVLAKKQSIALAFAVSPNVYLPFKNVLANEFSDNEDALHAIKSTRFTRINAMLEYRFYTGDYAPQGFYVTPFVRYMHINANVDYTFSPADRQLHTVPMTGKLNGFGGGAMIGYQWLLKKNLAIDLWILGGFYGPQVKADFHGTDPQMESLTAQDRTDLENNIEDISIPGYTTEATVGTNTIDIKMRGPYIGFRGIGVCIAYRF